MLKHLVAPCVWLVGLLTASSVSGRTFFLSPGGDDAAEGSREAPWQTLGKANAAVAPGDTVVLLPGHYSGCIEPGCSGTADAPITFRIDAPDTVVLTGGKSSDRQRVALRLIDRAYITIDGFQFRPQPTYGWVRLDGTRYCIIRNCYMEHVQGATPFMCRDCHYNRYENVRCLRAANVGKWGHVHGDMWNNFNCSHNVFYRVTISRAGHRPFGLWFDSPFNVVRECVFDCRWGRNFEFFSTPRLLVERCIITNGFDGSGSADGRAKLFIIDSIFRRNVIYRNWYGPLVINSYKYEDLPTFGMFRSRLYHNTWYRNHEYGFQMTDLGRKPDPHMVAGNIFKNNIFAFNDPGGDGLAFKLGDNIAPDNRFIRNLLYGQAPGAHTVRIDWPGNEWLTTAEADLRRSNQFARNLDVDPCFVDADVDDYRLRANSPAQNAADPLARTLGSGTGATMAVDDARWFYDGFGIPGEEGDRIVLSDGRTARVLKVDIETNTLTLDRQLSWSDGEGVSLPFTGAAPDLGAYETGMTTGPVIPEELRLETMETATRPLVVTDFETENLEDWFYLWNFSRQHHTDARIDEETAASGRRSMRVFATDEAKDKNDAIMACDIRPRWWDIDRFPFLSFSYRIPKGVPVGLWLYPFQSSAWNGRGRVCVGGSPARKTGDDLGQILLTDDGQWHEVTVDARLIREKHAEVKLLQMFRFETSRNGSYGDQFWFDNFRILPVEGTEDGEEETE